MCHTGHTLAIQGSFGPTMGHAGHMWVMCVLCAGYVWVILGQTWITYGSVMGHLRSMCRPKWFMYERRVLYIVQ